MKPRAWLTAYLLSLMLVACSAQTTPASIVSAPVTPKISTIPAQAPSASTQIMASEPAPSNSEQPESALISTATPTQIPEEIISSPVPDAVHNLPDPTSFTWSLVSDGLDKPIGLAHAGDGSGRLFVIEQEGRIRILQDGELLPEPFLDIRKRISCCGERGLLGIAFHPNYIQNGYFYINYTEEQGKQLFSVISRYQVSTDANVADPTSELRLLQQPQPYANHNGGNLQFGSDGYLYIGLGDGGAAGDPEGNAQSLDTWLGKLLRIDVDGGVPYAIPADNPYVPGGGLLEIWAYGLRNPWRFSFDSLTGDLYIGDVGQGTWEEIDFLVAGSSGGANFGWDYFEGAHPYEGSPPADLAFVPPVAEYSHSEGISVTGGYVYRGNNLPEWWGVYLYGDYGTGNIWGLLRKTDGTWETSLLFQTGINITSFGVDETGEVYLVNYLGSILRLDRK